MSSDIHKDIILDYYRNPRRLESACSSKRPAPLCGDVVEMQPKVNSKGRDAVRGSWDIPTKPFFSSIFSASDRDRVTVQI